MKPLRYLSLFSGIEAATVAWKPLGWECAGVAEIEPFPCSVLNAHYPDVPKLGDVTKVRRPDIQALGHIDIVVFGSPCQDLSIAGKRAGMKGVRSGLFFTAMRIVRWSRARFALWENVPGAYSSSKGRDFAEVVRKLSGLRVDVPEGGWRNTGVAAGFRGIVEWSTLDAQWFGVPQRRRRIFALADFGDWASRPPVLFESHSLSGHNPPSREAGQGASHDIAPSITSSGRGVERTGESLGQDPVIACSAGDISHCLNAGGMRRIDYETETFVTHALRADGFDASEDGTGRGTPLVPVAFVQNTRDEIRLFGGDGQTVGALAAEPGMKQQSYIAFSCKDHGADASDIAPTLRSMGHDGSHANAGGQVAVCVGWNGNTTPKASVDLMRAMRAQQGGEGYGISSCMAVRRLTPEECEALQGFPRGYTAVPHRGKPAADGPRYKALGNSMAVPVMAWIGRRIMEASGGDK